MEKLGKSWAARRLLAGWRAKGARHDFAHSQPVAEFPGESQKAESSRGQALDSSIPATDDIKIVESSA